jgi:DNA-binding transcriptional MerR regulator
MEYLIGDFSLITRISIKTLRFYHQENLLVPSRIDGITGYRFYGESQIQAARMILMLKQLDFTLTEIRTILLECSDDEDLYDYLKTKKIELDTKIKTYRLVSRKITGMIKTDEKAPVSPDPILTEGTTCLYISIRFHGRYDQVGERFSELFRQAGPHACGTPFSLYYDPEYGEEGTDIEACLPVKSSAKNLATKMLESRPCISAVHSGSYQTIGYTYKKIFDDISAKNLKMGAPIQEFYLKGPGFFFPGNPQKFKTRIEIPLLREPGPALQS